MNFFFICWPVLLIVGRQSVSLSLLYLCVYACLSIYLSIYLSLSLSVCLIRSSIHISQTFNMHFKTKEYFTKFLSDQFDSAGIYIHFPTCFTRRSHVKSLFSLPLLGSYRCRDCARLVSPNNRSLSPAQRSAGFVLTPLI